MKIYDNPKIEIRETSNRGLGTFATQPIARDELILVTLGQVQRWADADEFAALVHPFQLEIDVVITPFGDETTGIFAVNHSCSPNAGIRGQVSLVALRPISAGEEICYDYVMTDSDYFGQSIFEMECLCGAPECRKRVSDRDWHRADLRERYKGYFSSYLEARIRNG